MIDEPDRDRDLLRKLGELPQPEVPSDLTSRIVRNVTQLPQQSAEPAVSDVPARRRRARDWWPRAIGAAIAACAIGALLLHAAATPDRIGIAAAPPAATKPAVKVVTGPVEVRIAASEAPPAASDLPVRTRTASPHKPARSAPHLEIAEPVAIVPLQAQVEPGFEAERLPPIAPSTEQTEHALVGPTDPHGKTGPMLRGGPAPGLGFSGSGASIPGQ